MVRVAINGMGRIGRATLRIIFETPELEFVAGNDLGSHENIAYLLKHDTVYRRFAKSVKAMGQDLIIDGKEYRFFNETDPSSLPWKELDIDFVFECTGHFTRKEALMKHLQAGAKYVILSAPSKSEDIGTVIHGVNTAAGGSNIISCASCTTNCITPVIEVLGRRIGILKSVMTTVHAYTATQDLVDGPNTKHMRRGRAGAANIVPTSTGAAIATTRALPEYKGLFDGVAIRVPVAVGSIADIVSLAKRRTSVEEINAIFVEEAESERYRGILGVTDDPIVSSDIIGDPRASIVDLRMTRVVDGDLVKVMSWYDNEWGYSSQMVKEAVSLAKSLGLV